MDKTLDKQWLVPALSSLANAQRELVYAIRAFERDGGNFDDTIKNIKQTIGDLEVVVTDLEEWITTSKVQDNG
tara:strand:- start:414 stop:632 length:219 start_codon:yes stop_codon:yes gene_type:complete